MPLFKATIPNYCPRPKARPRVTRRGVYSPTANDERAFAWLLRAAASAQGLTQPITGHVCMKALFSGKSLRGDLDNYLKAACDALQKAGILVNDKQIRAATVELHTGYDEVCIVLEKMK